MAAPDAMKRDKPGSGAVLLTDRGGIRIVGHTIEHKESAR